MAAHGHRLPPPQPGAARNRGGGGVVTLAAAAICTTHARLGASVFILGHRHPVVMAKTLMYLLAKGAPAVVDSLGEYKRLGLDHILLEFRRDDLGRMLEILDLVTGTVRPAVDRA
jgi:hypothetical protein